MLSFFFLPPVFLLYDDDNEDMDGTPYLRIQNLLAPRFTIYSRTSGDGKIMHNSPSPEESTRGGPAPKTGHGEINQKKELIASSAREREIGPPNSSPQTVKMASRQVGH